MRQPPAGALPAGLAADLAPLAWPEARLGEAMAALARAAGLAPHGHDPGPPPGHGRAEEQEEAWAEAAAAALGIEAEPVEVPYGEAGDLVRRAAPALLRLPGGGLLALLGKGVRRVAVLAPDGRRVRVAAADVCRALRAGAEARLGPEVDRLLDDAGVPARRRARVRAALLAERLAGQRLTQGPAGWLLALSPGASPWQAARRAGLPGHAARLVGAHLVQHAALLLSWWVLGRGVLQGRLDSGWLLAWALLLPTVIPFRTLELWTAAVLTTRAGVLLKQRLLAGVLRLAPEEIRHQGAGQLLGRVLSSEALEQLALSGVHVGLIAFAELALALPLLALGAGGLPHALLLLTWTGCTVLLSVRYFRQRRAWTAERLAMTHDLVESMVGYRTRLAQLSPERWHEGEDRALAEYVGRSARMDGRAAALRAAGPRGFLILSLLLLTPPFVAGTASVASLAVALGLVLFAAKSLWKLVRGLADLAEAAVTWEQVAGLFRAAGRPEATGDPAVLAAGAPADGGEAGSAAAGSPVVLEGHDLVFRYGERAEPALRGCSLTIRAGDRLLLEGPSGGGKSTLAALLVGLREPQSGLLLLGGLDRPTLGADGWRRRAVSAPQFQENHVLTDTLAFNLLLGRGWPPRPEDLAEAEQVCRELGLGDLLDRMPSGLFQMVGESGWQLSHGEKSRLYIARALLQRADLVVLDESFAALDPENLRTAMTAVLARARTLLVIAHP